MTSINGQSSPSIAGRFKADRDGIRLWPDDPKAAVAVVESFFESGPREVAELYGLAFVCEDLRFQEKDRQACLALRRKALVPS